jgi:hypothetical protein
MLFDPLYWLFEKNYLFENWTGFSFWTRLEVSAKRTAVLSEGNPVIT